MNVLLTGATGYLGSHVARSLLASRHRVFALVRHPAGAALLQASGIEPRAGDIERPESWEHALEGCEALVHCAAMVASWSRDRRSFARVNVEGSLGLVERARDLGISRIVVTNSFFALGPTPPGETRDERAADLPVSPCLAVSDYAQSKAEASRRLRILQRQGLPLVMVYPTVLVGPGPRTQGNHTAKVLADVSRRRLPGLIGDGEQVWNLVPVEDAARGHVLALERGAPGETYILGGEDWTQRRLVEFAARCFGVSPPRRRLGRGFPLAVACAAELWGRASGRVPMLTRGEVTLYDACWSFSSAKARSELGYVPGDVSEALSRTAAWLQAGAPRA